MFKNEKSLLAFDLDGTLLLPNGLFPFDLLFQLRQMCNEGHVIAIISGRSIGTLKHYGQLISPSCYLCAYNGAIIYRNEKYLKQYPISISTAERLILLSSQSGYPVSVSGVEYLLFSTFGREDLRPKKNYHVPTYYLSYDQLMDYYISNKPYKLIIYCGDEIQAGAFAELIKEDQTVECVLMGREVEITAKNVNKGTALREIMKLEDGKPVISFGDSNNDIPMYILLFQ